MMMMVELPILYLDRTDKKGFGINRQNREFYITRDESIQSITQEIHANPAIDAHGVIKFNYPDAHDRYTNPILTLESDWPGADLPTHRRIALWVGRRLHRDYHCQIQVVWSGNVSYHIHFRINRRNLLREEAVANQRCLTDRMERLVRKKFKLPKYVFDRTVTNRLDLVRLGGATRVHIKHKIVNNQ